MENKLSIFYEIKDSLTAEDFSSTLGYYGLKIVKNSFLCPFHGDRHYGSCIIRKDGKSAYCFACHRKINAIDLVEHFENMTPIETAKFLWTVILGRKIPAEQQRHEGFPLKYAELKAIGIFHPNGRLADVCNAVHKLDPVPEGMEKMVESCSWEGVCPVRKMKLLPLSIYELYDSNPESVLEILGSKAYEEVARCKNLINEINLSRSPIGRICADDPEIREETLRALRSKTYYCNKILRKIQKAWYRVRNAA